MTYLVDTDRVAEYLKGRADAVALLTRLRADGLAISLVTFGELYDGIYGASDPAAAERLFRQFLRRVTVLTLNRTIMRRFARLRGQGVAPLAGLRNRSGTRDLASPTPDAQRQSKRDSLAESCAGAVD